MKQTVLYTKNSNFKENELFIKIAVEHKKEIFLKAVFDENITDEEIDNIVSLAKSDNLTVILQPKTGKNKLLISEKVINSVFYKLISHYKNVRLIPQVHKFLNVK